MFLELRKGTKMIIVVNCPDFCEGKNQITLGHFEADSIEQVKDFVFNPLNQVAPNFALKYPNQFSFYKLEVRKLV